MDAHVDLGFRCSLMAYGISDFFAHWAQFVIGCAGGEITVFWYLFVRNKYENENLKYCFISEMIGW